MTPDALPIPGFEHNHVGDYSMQVLFMLEPEPIVVRVAAAVSCALPLLHGK